MGQRNLPLLPDVAEQEAGNHDNKWVLVVEAR